MNCGRSSSVEWKLPKLQRRVRFPSPAPPPPGYAPGGFVMPPRQARLASHALFYLPLAPLTQPYGRRVKGQNSPSTRPSRVEPVQNSPSSQPSRRHRYKTPPARSPAGDTGTKLSLHPQNGPFQHVLRQQGELYTACATNKPSRENFVPHAGTMPVQNSPRSQPSRVEPVQNSPRTPKMAHFSTYYASRENFVTLSPPTRRAGRKKSRTNTPPHPPTRPSPNFACNSIA